MRALIADGHALFREALAQLLDQQEGIEIVGEAGTVLETVEKTASLKPGVLLMEIFFPDASGLEAISTVRSLSPETKIVILTTAEEDEFLFTALRLGAKGYLTKNMSFQEIVSAFQALERGEAAIPLAKVPQILKEFSRMSDQLEVLKNLVPKSLTNREQQVLDYLALNATNREIAAGLGISEQTVKIHVRNILSKLGALDRREAGKLARRLGRGGSTCA